MSAHKRRRVALCECGRPVEGTVLCADCRVTLRVALVRIAAAYVDLEDLATGQRGVRYDEPRGKGPSRTNPLPLDARFLPGAIGSVARRNAQLVVVRWVRRIATERPGVALPWDTVGSACSWLAAHLQVIAAASWAPDCKRELLELERELAAVDHHAERIYAGLCTICLLVGEHTALYARPGEEWVRCPAEDCGADYRVDARRALMFADLEARLHTAAEIAGLATYLQLIDDRERVRKRINQWHHRGVLVASGERDGEPLFVFGDVTARLLAGDAQTRAAAASTRGKPAR